MIRRNMKPVAEFEILDHGVEHEQYFQGCGVSFTKFEDVATGIGSSAIDAFEDALEQLACQGWDVESIKPPEGMSEEIDIPTEDDYDDDANEDYEMCIWHYVSVRVR